MSIYFIESHGNDGPHIPDSKNLAGHEHTNHKIILILNLTLKSIRIITIQIACVFKIEKCNEQ